MRQSTSIRIVLTFLLLQCFVVFGNGDVHSFSFKPSANALQDSLQWADYYYNIQRYDKAIPLYKKNLNAEKTEKNRVLKKLALSEAALEHPKQAVGFLNEYLLSEFKPSFLLHEGFDQIRTSEEFDAIANNVTPEITAWSIFYFIIALIGFYVLFIIGFNKSINPMARILISSFLFIHSFFILNISVNIANYLFEFPHAYLMSTWASFLYGPLLYFYFKRITEKYRFKAKDLLHSIPTILLLGYMIPNVYWLSSDEKISIMFTRLVNGVSPRDSNQLVLLVALKAISLIIYAIFINRVYKKSKAENRLDEKTKIWQKNIYGIHVGYIVTYVFYGLLITNGYSSGIFYQIPIIMMALMVIYVGYAANLQPHVFSGIYTYTNRLFPKYVKSGLTESLSYELKNNLTKLFTEEKLYRKNDINLEMVAQKLNTTRHNASQIINEHFQMSFHEFVNSYRINEAKHILSDEKQKDLNIIDIAYEVGYNNKVTFNKAFKKDTQLTPTQYLSKFRTTNENSTSLSKTS